MYFYFSVCEAEDPMYTYYFKEVYDDNFYEYSLSKQKYQLLHKPFD